MLGTNIKWDNIDIGQPKSFKQGASWCIDDVFNNINNSKYHAFKNYKVNNKIISNNFTKDYY